MCLLFQILIIAYQHLLDLSDVHGMEVANWSLGQVPECDSFIAQVPVPTATGEIAVNWNASLLALLGWLEAVQ